MKVHTEAVIRKYWKLRDLVGGTVQDTGHLAAVATGAAAPSTPAPAAQKGATTPRAAAVAPTRADAHNNRCSQPLFTTALTCSRDDGGGAINHVQKQQQPEHQSLQATASQRRLEGGHALPAQQAEAVERV